MKNLEEHFRIDSNSKLRFPAQLRTQQGELPWPPTQQPAEHGLNSGSFTGRQTSGTPDTWAVSCSRILGYKTEESGETMDPNGGEGEMHSKTESEGRQTRGPLASTEGQGCGNHPRVPGRGCGQAWEPRGGRQAQRRPPTRHCLDAAIIVSSEHPGSACAAEKELNKERGRKKKASKAAQSLPARLLPARPRLFLCLGSPLCAPQALLRGTDPRSSEKPGGDGAGIATLGSWPTVLRVWLLTEDGGNWVSSA